MTKKYRVKMKPGLSHSDIGPGEQGIVTQAEVDAFGDKFTVLEEVETEGDNIEDILPDADQVDAVLDTDVFSFPRERLEDMTDKQVDELYSVLVELGEVESSQDETPEPKEPEEEKGDKFPELPWWVEPIQKEYALESTGKISFLTDDEIKDVSGIGPATLKEVRDMYPFEEEDASAAAIELAEQTGVDISELEGSGEIGQVTVEDVRDALGAE